MRSPKAWVSLWIVLAVTLHAVPIALRQRQNQTTWPWLTWAMYKDSRPAGPIEGERRRLSGLTQAGHQVVIDEDSVGLSKFVVNRLFIRPWQLGDTTAAPRLFAQLNQRRRDPLVKIRLSVESYTVTDSGMAVQRQTWNYEPDVTGAQ
ncbi:MAG TPA: hypothetical protein VJQ44_18925 [Gemmatimonadales bacterium]|nr:hypothetical protein [Gemmatimonadales bacterium]